MGHAVMAVDDASWATVENMGMRLGLKGIGFVNADARRLPFKPNTFDYVFCISVIEHLKSATDVNRVVEECVRVARHSAIFTVDEAKVVEHLLPLNNARTDYVLNGNGARVAGIVFEGGAL